MSNAKENVRVLGKYKPRRVLIPSNACIPRIDVGQSIIELRTTRNWRYYFGVGMVLGIYKSDSMDCVYVDFGKGKEKPARVYCIALNPRKQIYTLKIGQYAQFGLLRHKEVAKVGQNTYMGLWCMGIYVPKAVDIRNTELTQEEINDMNDDDFDNGKSFLDMFEKNE